MPIDTLVFDYGGVIVNIDDRQVTEALVSLGVSHLKQLFHARQIKELMREFIDGLVPMDDTLQRMLSLCRPGTTREQILDVLNRLCGDLPVSRLQALVELRKHYKVYLLSNINDFLWQKSAQEIRARGFEPEDCFDGLYMSYQMHLAKPDASIYEQMIAQSGLDPQRTLYFDDRENNYEAGRALGFQAVLVKTNHLEETSAWQELQLCLALGYPQETPAARPRQEGKVLFVE